MHSVPVSKLPDLVDVAKREFEKAGLFGPILGHVGDGKVICLLRGAPPRSLQTRVTLFISS